MEGAQKFVDSLKVRAVKLSQNTHAFSQKNLLGQLSPEIVSSRENRETATGAQKVPDYLKLPAGKLSEYTDGFSENNLLGDTMFGKLYRGKIVSDSETREITVKIYLDIQIGGIRDRLDRLRDEVKFLSMPEMMDHPNIAKLIGYNDEDEPPGVVYDVNPRDTLQNLLCRDDFTWLQRIKCATRFARLLEFLNDHADKYFVCNISASHVMINQDDNPLLFEFGNLSGGCFGVLELKEATTDFICGVLGYRDPYVCGRGFWSSKCDVFTYGMLLLGSITKRLAMVVDAESTLEASLLHWALKVYDPKKSLFTGKLKCSLVDASFADDSDFNFLDGPKITRLAMRCISRDPSKRPTMKEVVKVLGTLCIAKIHGEALSGIQCAQF